MSFPFISLIIPVYKVESYIEECLDSILSWQFSDWEAILIDDGSPDASGAICDAYAQEDSRFKVVHKQNEGVSVARNVGLDLAKGEWCWFVDSDDVIDAHIPVDVRLLGGKDIVMFDLQSFNDGEPIPSQNGNGTFEQCTDLNTFYNNHISWAHPTLWYHRKFWDKDGKYAIRFSKGIRIAEDIEFMRKCELISNNPLKINYVSYYYRLRQGSAMHSADRNKKLIVDTFAVLRNMLFFIRSFKVRPAEWKAIRLMTIAKTIPTHAVTDNVWVQNKNEFKAIVKEYKKEGFDLRKDLLVWFSVIFPSVFPFVLILYKKMKK
ncbi:glycosyltransferase family 2 protein [Bacteroides zhangwenhongii]|uniref:glycosyltransferase family 2 protein n=1 Tax=Bacteroides zhangwenhongii TaxID=2650157 RepID=UPI003AAF554A